MMFNEIKKEVLEDSKKRLEKAKLFIENGPDSVYDGNPLPDYLLERYLTDTRLKQYKAGVITREKAVEYAIKRYAKRNEKATVAMLEKLERIAVAEDVDVFSIYIDRKRTSGNVSATIYAGTKHASGYASGCGYDKESTAIAEAFNSIPELLKIVCALKEKALANGVSSESKASVTGRDNYNVVGYGTGYLNIPYLHGGAGTNCFISIFEKAGFKYTYKNNKQKTSYTFYKA